MSFIVVSTGTNRTFWEVIKTLCGINALSNLVATKANQTQVTSIANTLLTKANSAQPAFQPLPFTGGSSSTGLAAEFFKDTLGILHFRGNLICSYGQSAAVLPVGSRPSKNMRFAVASDDITTTRVTIATDGVITLFGKAGAGTNSTAFLEGIPPFRAEL